MEDVDKQKLSRKELLQLCADKNIRTAGVKQDDLVRLLQKKLQPPATDPSRVRTKTRSQTSTNPPMSSPRGKEKAVEKTPSTPGSTSQRRSLRPLVLVDDPSMKASPEPSPRKNQQLLPNPGVPPRKPIATTPNTPPAQRSDLLHKKVTALTAIGKLQAQERARPGQKSDGRGPSNMAAAAGVGKQAQERQPQRSDGASVRSRSSNAPKKSIRSTSMEPVKRPSERVKRNEASRFKAQTNPKLNAAYLEAAAKRSPRTSAASATATAGSRSDLGSHDFDSVSEIATDVGHEEDSDDGRSVTSVASEPASRFTSQLHSPRTITGSKLGQSVSHSAHGRNCSFDESCHALEGKHSDPSSGENLISLEDDTTFNLVGDAHEVEISSFLNANIVPPDDIDAAERSQIPAPEISCEDKDIIVCEESSVREQDAGTSAESVGHSESAPSDNLLMDIRESAPVEETRVHSPGAEDENSFIEVSHLDESSGDPKTEETRVHSPGAEDENSFIEVSHLDESSGDPKTEETRVHSPGAEDENSFIEVSHLDESSGDPKTEETVSETAQAQDVLLSNAFEAEEGQVILTSKKKDEGETLIDDEESPNAGVISNVQLERSPLHQESPDDSSAPSTNDLPQDSSITSTAESVHSILDTPPVPHPNMDRSSITPMSVDSSPTPDDLETAGEQELRAKTLRSPCDELQQDFEIKLRRDYSKDGSKKSNVLEDRSVKVPLLQHGHDTGNTHIVRRSFPSSILLWCSQLFSAIFGTRSERC